MKKTEITYTELRQAYGDLQENLRASSQPKIKEGYKSARQIAQELNMNYSTVRENLKLARDKGVVPIEYYIVNGHRTAHYRLK